MRPFIAPLALALCLLALAPFWGTAQVLFRQRFSDGTFLVVVAAVLALVALSMLAWVVRQLLKAPRSERSMRVVFLVVALVLLLAFGFETGRPLVTLAVERLHLALYSLIGLLCYRGFRRSPAVAGIYEALAAFLGGTLVGVLDEGVQALAATRVGEIYDIRINVAAVLAGVLLGFAVFGWAAWGAGLRSAGRRLAACLAMLLVLAVGAFVHRAHLGYEIEDPELGTMRSYYDKETLERLSVERRERWKDRKPRLPHPLELEDRLRTEASYHVTKRNQARSDQDWVTAWHEHRLTERYYSAFLDSAGRRKDNHRLDPILIEEIERGLPAGHDKAAHGYRSAVLTEPEIIWLWSKGRWWLSVGFVLILIFGLGFRRLS